MKPDRMKVRDLLTLDVEDLALGGKALARHEGRVVFVDRGLPGDRITARVTRAKRSFAEARLVSLETPAPGRVSARCVISRMNFLLCLPGLI